MKHLLLGILLTVSAFTTFCQTTFKLQLIAEGNFGTPNGDVFLRNTTLTPATSSTGLYQQANSTTGFDVLQDFKIAGSKAILLSKGTSFRVVVANYPSFTHVQTFTGVGAPQTIAVASNSKAYVSSSNPNAIRCINLVNNTISQVTDANNDISSYSNHMVFASGHVYAQIGAKIVKIDTATNAVVGTITPLVGSITGLVTDAAQSTVWVMGTVSGTATLKSINVADGQVSPAITLTGVGATKNVRYYNGQIYFWSAKNLHRYNIASPNIPTSSIYLSALPGSSDPFGYTRAFDIDETNGDFVIASANNYTAPSYYEVVDGTTFALIESGTMPGCAIVNNCVLQTYHDGATPPPVPNLATLPTIAAECAATLTAPTATANNGSTLTGTTTDPTSYSSQGTYTVTWTYADGNSSSTTQTQTIVIDDTTAPEPDNDTLAAITGDCSASVTAPTATDNCAGVITATTSDPLSYTQQGTHTITWTFADGHGNSSIQTQAVIVDDNTAPVADVATLPAIVGECEATLTAPTATDNCSGSITATTTDPLTYNTVGVYSVNWTYTDANGNSSSQQQSVIVNCSLGLEDATAATAIVYPNPANTSVQLVTKFNGAVQIELRDLSGNRVYAQEISGSTATIDVSALSNGVYFLHCFSTDGAGVSAVKLVVAH